MALLWQISKGYFYFSHINHTSSFFSKRPFWAKLPIRQKRNIPSFRCSSSARMSESTQKMLQMMWATCSVFLSLCWTDGTCSVCLCIAAPPKRNRSDFQSMHLLPSRLGGVSQKVVQAENPGSFKRPAKRNFLKFYSFEFFLKSICLRSEPAFHVRVQPAVLFGTSLHWMLEYLLFQIFTCVPLVLWGKLSQWLPTGVE